MEALRDQVPAGTLRGITEALMVSYQRLTEPHARLLAQLAPEPIPVRLLDAFGDVFTPAVRAALMARALISPVESADVPMFGRMHRVLADFLRTQSPADAELAQAVNALNAALSAEVQDPQHWRDVNAWKPHGERVFVEI